jgi:hypothetical protein
LRYALDVLTDGMVAEVQASGDLPVGEALGDKLRYLTLAGGQGDERPTTPPRLLRVELEHRHQRSTLVRQTARIPVQPTSTPGHELDINASGEAGRSIGRRCGHPVDSFLAAADLRQKPPGCCTQAHVERLAVAHHDRAARELERGPRTLELLLEILASADTLNRGANDAAVRSSVSASVGP